jgi:hypothetical protein
LVLIVSYSRQILGLHLDQATAASSKILSNSSFISQSATLTVTETGRSLQLTLRRVSDLGEIWAKIMILY